MLKCRACTKKTTSQKWKFGSNKKLGLEWTMNRLGKPFRKKNQSKKSKKAKNKEKLPLVNKNHWRARKWIFVQTLFSHLHFKIRANKFHAAKPLDFLLHFLFRRDQNHCSNFDFKNHENVWTDLKKKTAPQYNSNSLNCNKYKGTFEIYFWTSGIKVKNQ